METNKVRISNRKKAYDYIKKAVNSKIRSVTSDTDLADVLGGQFGLKDSLKSLREGKSDPSPRLIVAFKELFGPTISKGEVNSYLVEPFKNEP